MKTVTGIETSRPLRIAAKMRAIAEIKKISEDYGDAMALEEGAAEIERLYNVLQESFKVAEKAVAVASA
jgi:hypothetical protein